MGYPESDRESSGLRDSGNFPDESPEEPAREQAEAAEPERKKPFPPVWVRAVMVVLFLAWIVLTAVGGKLYFFSREPALSGGRALLVNVERGLAFPDLADRLAGNGVVRSAFWFRALARLTGDDKKVKAGEYRLSPNMTPLAVLGALREGRAVLHRLFVVEGAALPEVAAGAEKSGIARAREILALARDPAEAHALGIPADNLEGYLFPDTYFLEKGAGARAVISVLYRRFANLWTPEWETRAGELGLSRHQVVTLASIIQKEAGSAEEFKTISSVFHNRLKKGMRLQSDPTVIYGIPDFNGNLTRAHLRTPGPYNTYVNHGLPPGPIANPGRGALFAALNPDTTPYLYFVSMGNGRHKFSQTLAEHNRAVRKYQSARPVKRRESVKP